MKIVPGTTNQEIILEFSDQQQFDEFFTLAEHQGYFVIDSCHLPDGVFFRARAHGSPRSRKIKPLNIFNDGKICRVDIREQSAPVPPKEPQVETKTAETTVGKSLHEKIRSLPLSERVSLARTGDYHERRVLMQENNPKIHEFLLRNPRITEAEIAWMAGTAVSPMQTILAIANHREWMKVDSIRSGILTNPKTPAALVMEKISTLSAADLIKMHRTRLLREDVHAAVKREMRKRGIQVKIERNEF